MTFTVGDYVSVFIHARSHKALKRSFKKYGRITDIIKAGTRLTPDFLDRRDGYPALYTKITSVDYIVIQKPAGTFFWIPQKFFYAVERDEPAAEIARLRDALTQIAGSHSPEQMRYIASEALRD